MKSTTKRIHLDWARLFGFSQVKSAQHTPEARAIIGGKIGGKIGAKGLPPVNV